MNSIIELDQKIELKWNKTIRKYYEDKGYDYTGNGDVFKVKVRDIPITSRYIVKATCDICNKEISIPYRNYNKNVSRNTMYVCQPCSSRVRYDNELSKRRNDYMERLNEMCKSKDYSLLSDKESIFGNTSYIQYKCPLHGTHSARIGNFLSGKGCPDCAKMNNRKRFQLSVESVINRVKECGGELLNPYEYVNQSECNLRFRCSECGKEFVSCLQRYTQHGGQVCKECSGRESLGERKIRKYLDNNKIEYVQYHWFPDCRDIKPLPFDFYLQKMNTIIEFDGRQHFFDTDYFSYSLEKTVEHDTIKNNYCLEKGIKLIRIQYKDINHIPEILNQKLFT